MKKLMAAASGGNIVQGIWEHSVYEQNSGSDFQNASVHKIARINDAPGIWRWLGHAGKELLQAAGEALDDLSNETDSYRTDPEYLKPTPFKPYQAPNRSRNNEATYHRTGPFSVELFNQIMRDAHQNNLPNDNVNLSFVKAPPSGFTQSQNPPVMGQGSEDSNHYFAGITHSAPAINPNMLGFSDPNILYQALANNYNYDAELERAQAAEDLKTQQLRQQQALRATAQTAGQQTAQNVQNMMLAKKSLVKKVHPRGKTLAEIAGEITGHNYQGKFSFDTQRALDLKRLARELQQPLLAANRKALSVVQARYENTQTKAPGHDHDADYNANTAYGFLEGVENRGIDEKRRNEKEFSDWAEHVGKQFGYPTGVEYVGKLEFPVA